MIVGYLNGKQTGHIVVDRYTYPFQSATINGDYITAGSPENLAGIQISEAADNARDDPNILGDIPNDRFTLTTTGPRGILYQYPLVYTGTAGGGFVGGIAGPVKGGSVFGPPFGPAEFYDDYTPTAFVKLGGSLSSEPFLLNRGEAFDLAALCLVQGSKIRTVRGSVAVEALRVGDVAVTASGMHRRIVWLGSRVLEATNSTLPFEAWPVRVRAGAFGTSLPERDLYLSPGHPVLIGRDDDNEGGVLVPVMCLINGTSIDRAPAGSVTYWHVELDEHDILVAEGLPVESYIDLGSRAWFEAASTNPLTNPDLVPVGRNGRCRPVATDGPLVEAERRRLAGLFEAMLNAQAAWPSPDEHASMR